MLSALATAALIFVTIAALVSLVDSSLVARAAAAELSRERALARMGFVAQLPAREIRPRPALPHGRGAMAQAVRARGLPLRFAVPRADAA